MAQRIVRAKRKLRDNHAAVPGPARGRAARPAPRRAGRDRADLHRGPHRHLRATGSSAPTCRPRRSGSAGCWCELMPDEPEAVGPARPDAAHRRPAAGPARRPTASMVRLADQDRSRWDRGADRPRATTWCGPACAATSPGRSRSRPRSPRCTPTRPPPTPPTGRQIVALYDQLHALRPERRGGAEPGHRRSASCVGPPTAWPRSARIDADQLDALPAVPRRPGRPARPGRTRRRGASRPTTGPSS